MFGLSEGLEASRRQMVAWDLVHWVLAGAGSPRKVVSACTLVVMVNMS